ncbi:MAG: acyl-CoA dehydrogenase family protein [Chloroflexi bacterium]|nr:acyl-CoA dehydrogenase family protein [Chloroflexota bacterium]
MEFGFDEEQILYRDVIRRFALEKLLPNYQKWDREGGYLSRQQLHELGDLGILGLRVPEEYGGQAASFVNCGIATEELSRGDFNYNYFVQLFAIAAELLGGYAEEPLKREWLPKIASGDAVMGFALTEPGAGSDAANIQTRAIRDGDEYRISGEKASISFAGFADAAVVFARVGDQPGARGIGSFLVPLDDKGVTRQVYRSPGEKLAGRGSLFFDEVRIPVSNRIGDERGGFIAAMVAFDFNRAIIGLGCVGTALQSLEETIEYVKQRQAFGRPLAKFEGVSFQIAEHLTMIHAARHLCYETLWLKDQGRPHTKQASMAKLLAPRAAAEAVHTCLLLHGHAGYNLDAPFDQRWRDIVGLEIGDGTAEVMKLVIVREMLGREFLPYR